MHDICLDIGGWLTEIPTKLWIYPAQMNLEGGTVIAFPPVHISGIGIQDSEEVLRYAWVYVREY